MAKIPTDIPNTRVPAAGKGLALDQVGLIPTNAMGTGTPSNTVYLRGDRAWVTLSGVLAPAPHAASHQHGGSDPVALAVSAANAIPKAGASGALDIAWIPTGSTSTTVCIGNDSRLSDSRTPTAHATTHVPGGTDAIATGATSVTLCIGNDARLSDSRTPLAHATSHKSGGSDEVATATAAINAIPKTGGLASTLAIGWIPTGTTNQSACIGNDSRLSDARTPTAHASTHAPNGSDVTLLANGKFDPGSVTIPTGQYALFADQIQLTTTEALTMQGTSIVMVT